MAVYMSDIGFSDQDTSTATDDSTTCDDEANATSTSDSDGEDQTEICQLVSPKQPITTVTKQAEISPTEKIFGIRKLSPGINLRQFNVRKPSPPGTSQSENSSVTNQSAEQSSGTCISVTSAFSHSGHDVTSRIGGSNKTLLSSIEGCSSTGTYPSREARDYGIDQTSPSINENVVTDIEVINSHSKHDPGHPVPEDTALPQDATPSTQVSFKARLCKRKPSLRAPRVVCGISGAVLIVPVHLTPLNL